MVTAIQSATPAANRKTADDQLSGVTSMDFLKLLIQQLQNQDPTEPFSSKDMLAQVSQLRELQASIDLSGVLEQLAQSQQLGSAGSLLGKMITGIDQGGNEVTGLAVSVRVDDDKIYLELDTGERLALDNVRQINVPQVDQNQELPTADS